MINKDLSPLQMQILDAYYANNAKRLHRMVDGLQRGSTFMKFRYGNYKVTTSVEEPIITYCAKVKDADGEIMLDGNGDIVWEDRQFDIRNKTYDKLPEELKKIFDEYQIETVVHEGYSMAEISKFVRRYNFHKSMNTSQKMFTFVDRHARKIREILRKRFFVECTGYTKGERKMVRLSGFFWNL